MTISALFDVHGHVMLLDRQVARGGEGAIHTLKNGADLVAKIYHRPVDPAKAVKLAAMARLRTDRLAALTAWPTGTLYARLTGPVTGLLMPRVADHKPIFELYNPKSRLVAFPGVDWRFLLHVATNVVRAVDVIHAHGHVIGDINYSGILVSADGTVRFIDCDSFQVAANGCWLLCTVGVPDFTPPELNGLPLDRVIRSPNHDAFGLAVLVFHLLFLGRHPFAGTYLGGGDMPIPRAIAEGRFAYGQRAAQVLMQQPPHSLPLAGASASVAALFERAFSDDVTITGRPSAKEWLASLTDLARHLRQCMADGRHVFSAELVDCPWCPIEAATSAQLF